MSIDYKRLYKLLETVSPVPFDCGTICGAACCRTTDEGMGIYLLPGEEDMREREEWESFEEEDGCLFVRCKGPERCDRNTRPIQCRTFPLFPVLTPDRGLVLSFNPMELPYSCPLIESDAALVPDFIEVTEQVWQELTEDPAVCGIVEKWNLDLI